MPDPSTIRRAATVAAFVLLILYAVFGATPYGLRVLTVAGVYALAAVGYQLVFGLGGALSMAQGAFFGLGAYTAGILGARYGLGFTLTFPAAVAVPALVGLAVGLPVLRLQSHYFALATLGIAQVVLLAAVNLPGLTGGANGFGGVPGIVLSGWMVPRGLPLAAVVWGLVAIGAGIAAGLARANWGRALRLARDDTLAAVSLGLDTGALRLGAFLLSAAYAGAAGALAAHTQHVVSPEVLEFPVMVTVLTICVVGGRGRIAGTVLAAVLLAQVPEWFRFLERSYLLLHGVVLLAVIVLIPEGIGGVIARLLPNRPLHPPPPQPLPPAPVNAGEVLRVEGLTKAFGGVVAVENVGFALEAGRIAGLIGANGSGKTTLINLISGIERADAGRIRLIGHDITRIRADRRARLGLARTFQTPALPEEAPVLEAVAAAGLADGVPSRLALARAMAALDELGHGDLAARVCGDLPAGSRRWVEIARALARQPRLLLLDEPAAGLTDAEKVDLARILHAIAARGIAVLVVEHDLAFLTGLAGRLLVMDEGRLISDGDPAAVLADPRVIDAYGTM